MIRTGSSEETKQTVVGLNDLQAVSVKDKSGQRQNQAAKIRAVLLRLKFAMRIRKGRTWDMGLARPAAGLKLHARDYTRGLMCNLIHSQ